MTKVTRASKAKALSFSKFPQRALGDLFGLSFDRRALCGMSPPLHLRDSSVCWYTPSLVKTTRHLLAQCCSWSVFTRLNVFDFMILGMRLGQPRLCGSEAVNLISHFNIRSDSAGSLLGFLE